MTAHDSDRAPGALAFAYSRQAGLIVAPVPGRWPIIDVNEAYLRVTGRTRAQLLGRALFEAFPESAGTSGHQGAGRIATSLREAMEGRLSRLPVQRYDLPRPGDPASFDEHFWELSTTPLCDANGVVTALLHEVLNVTERERLAASVEAQNTQLMDQSLELELTNQQLQENAIELEAQAEALQDTALLLEARSAEAERAFQALQERESQLRTLADAIPTLAWTARADGFIEWYNARWYEYTGTTAADMEGWGWQRVHDPETLPRVMEEWGRSIETGEPFEMTFPLRGADGVFRPFLTRVTAERDAAGQVTRWFGTNTNVEHEHLARRSAEEANAAKTTFLATMSHELRTPLNALGGYLDLLLMELRGPLSADQRADLERMQRSQRHLSGLINEILNFAKIDTGHAEFEIGSVDVANVLRRVEELVSPQCAAKSLAYAIEIADADLHAQADDERVGQILLNLLGNAVKYTPSGGRIVAACARDDTHVVIRITDTGIGIAPEQLTAIFNPFVQVGRRLNAPAEGVGLGLAISRTLAEGMQGTLAVDSVVGAGSTFTLRLPATHSR